MDSAELKKLEQRVTDAKMIESKIRYLTDGLQNIKNENVTRINIDKCNKHNNVLCYLSDSTVPCNVSWTSYCPEAVDDIKKLMVDYFEQKLKTLKEEYSKL